MIETLIWDWNGTLLDDVEPNLAVINGILEAMGRPVLTIARYRDAFTMPVIDFYRAIGLDPSPAEFDRIAADYTAAYGALFPTMSLTAGIADAIRDLADAGIGHYVLSATRQDVLERQVGAHGITPLFKRVKGNDNLHGASKVESARILAREEGIDPGKTLFVGDMLHDRDVAHAIGARCVLYSGGHQAIRDPGCPVVSDLARGILEAASAAG